MSAAANGRSVRLAYALVFSDQCGQADSLRRVERQIPSGAVPDFFAGLRLDGVAMLDQLLAGCGCWPFGKPVERFAGNCPGQPQRRRELAVPLAAQRAALAEVGVRRRRIFRAVIALNFAAGERFRDIKHVVHPSMSTPIESCSGLGRRLRPAPDRAADVCDRRDDRARSGRAQCFVSVAVGTGSERLCPAGRSSP